MNDNGIMELFNRFTEEHGDSSRKLVDISRNFQIPLLYNKEHRVIQPEVQEDLDIKNVSEKMYGTTFTDNVKSQLTNYYTTDSIFLKESQKYIKRLTHELSDYKTEPNFYDDWMNVLDNKNVHDHFSFMTIKYLDHFNYNPKFLLGMSLYNLTSPILSLVTPILFVFVLPLMVFHVMAAKSKFVTPEIKRVMKDKVNPIQQYITLFTTPGNFHKKIRSVSMIFMYLLSFYQNTLHCIGFYKNMYDLKQYIQNIRDYLIKAVSNMELLERASKSLKSFVDFGKSVGKARDQVQRVLNDVRFKKTDNKSFSPLNVMNIGDMMSLYYELREKSANRETIMYALDVDAYIHHLLVVCQHVNDKELQLCQFTNDRRKTMLDNEYHPLLIDERHVKNNILLDKNVIITGPNASGKTTMLKTTMINLLLSQQLGYGCYSNKSVVYPFDHYFSYLNIPDTSNRDSLFEAEAKRCLSFIHRIEEAKDNSFFLLFDEMYSGTNPGEASMAAVHFLKYLTKYNVTYMVTTHYYDICECEKLSDVIENMCMETTVESEQLKYTYQLKNGTSFVRGGIEVLKRLKYPEEILDDIKAEINKVPIKQIDTKKENRVMKRKETKREKTKTVVLNEI